MLLEVKSVEVTTRSGNAKATGKPYVINEQIVMVALNGELRKVKVALENNAPPYPLGAYQLTDESFFVDRFGALAVGRLKLRPVPASAAKVA